MNLRAAPTQVLPIIEVATPTGPFTSYPFGTFDLSDPLQRNKFALFDALAARVREWLVTLHVTYDDSSIPVSLAHSGTLTPVTNIESLGPSDIVIPGWNNPHSVAAWPALHQGDLNAYFLAHGDFAEEVLAMEDARIVGRSDALDVITTQGAYDMFALGNLLYNRTYEGPTLPLNVFTYRTRTTGYLALIFTAVFFVKGPLIGGSFTEVINAATQDYFAGGILPSDARPCGTFTIAFPNPYIRGNPPVTLTAPVFGSPSVAHAPTITFTLNATATPSQGFAYGGIFNNDGTTNVCPIN